VQTQAMTQSTLLCTHKLMLSMLLSAVDAKDAVKGAASKAAAGAQRMAGLEPKQGTHTCYSTPLGRDRPIVQDITR